MGSRLKDATYNSSKGYIDRKSDIQEIMGHINDLTLDELKSHCKKSYLTTFEIGLEMQDISTSYLNSMRYTDMLCVLNEIKINYQKMNGNEDEKSRMFFVYTIADALNTASSTCSWVNLFFSISVKAYLEFLAEKTGSTGHTVDFSDLNKLVMKTLEFELTDSTTIGTLIKETHKAVNKPWNILSYIQEYEENMHTAHRILDMLLVNSMETAYPMRFRLNEIRRNAAACEMSQKCSDIEKCD